MKYALILTFSLLSAPVFAQPNQTLFEQALAQKLSAEISGGLQCSAALLANQQELLKAQARIKTLEEKYEPPVSKP